MSAHLHAARTVAREFSDRAERAEAENVALRAENATLRAQLADAEQDVATLRADLFALTEGAP